VEVSKLSQTEWLTFSQDAHLICFSEHQPKELVRIDYALICHEGSTPISYVTLRELDSETVYMQFGGAFPSAKGTLKSFKSYEMFLDCLKQGYKRATTFIQNDNLVMLKFAMKAGFRIVGIRTFKGNILLEHLLEWQ